MTLRDIHNKIEALSTYVHNVMEASDLMNEAEAAVFLGITTKTLQNHVSNGTMDSTYTINRLGKRMYYKSKLIKNTSK